MGVKVSLSGDGLNYEGEASLMQAAKIIGFLNAEEPLLMDNNTSMVNTTATLIDVPQSKLLSSPREAILSSNAKTNTQKILVLGSYLAQRDNSDEFATAELKTLFVKAGEPAPRNLARDIRSAVKTGYITESMTSSDMYIVTNTGYKALDEGFSSSTTKKSYKKSSTKPSKRADIPEWLNDIPVEDQIEGFPSYRQVSTRSNRVLWILQWASSVGRERISGNEINTIADKLSDNIPAKQIAASLSPHISSNRASKTSEGYKILHDGGDFLKTFINKDN